MEFKINSDKLSNILKKIKSAKTFVADDESLSAILLDVKTDESGSSLKITSRNDACWSQFVLNDNDFVDYGKDKDKNWNVKDGGKIFVNGVSFIDRIVAAPKDTVITFKLEENKEKGSHLKSKYRTETGKNVTSGFMLLKPKYFEEDPIEEERKTITIKASHLIDAVDSVCFATKGQADDSDQFLWGCNLNISDDEKISSSGSNRKRICVYGETPSDKNTELHPVAGFLLPVIKNLVPVDDVDLEVGEKSTIITQGNHSYMIPNVNDLDKIPDYNSIVDNNRENVKVKIRMNRKELLDCVKSVGLVSEGMKITIDPKNSNIVFSSEKINESGSIQAVHEEEKELGKAELEVIDDSYEGDSYRFSVEFFKDVLQKISDDYIDVFFGDSESPVHFESDNSRIKYLQCSLSGIE